MLKVNYISNVNSTLKSTPSFGNGVQSNHGIETYKSDLAEGGFVAGFAGILRNSPFFSKISSRAESIEKGLSANESTGTKLNQIA